jgi:DNA-binding NarL/FixJ family response regulator
MKILIAESSIPILDRLENLILETFGSAAVLRAGSYKVAKDLFNEHLPGIVLLDVSLPKSLSLLEKIKKTQSKTCVIVLTVQIDLKIHDRYSSLGADFFLDKYYEFEKIIELLQDTSPNTLKKAE